MSSRPDPADLEGFIEDSFFLDRMAPGARECLIRFYESHRKQIECAMNEDYDPETMSWRDWRNAYWGCLPEPPLEEIKMSDEEVRGLERAATHDPEARRKLTVVRLRRRSGVVWLWIQVRLHAPLNLGPGPSPSAPVATPPPGAIELTVHGYATGGEIVLEGPQPPATPKRAWALACLSIEAAALGREEIPKSENVSGPYLLDLESSRLIHLSRTDDVFVGEPGGAEEP